MRDASPLLWHAVLAQELTPSNWKAASFAGATVALGPCERVAGVNNQLAKKKRGTNNKMNGWRT